MNTRSASAALNTERATATAPTRVAVFGASGLVGRALITTLLADPDIHEIHLLLRHPIADLPGDSRLHQHKAEFSNPDSWRKWLLVDAVFCTLGTTIKIAGSPAAFRAVDHTLVVTAASQAKRAGVGHFLVVSALGADAKSSVFYNRVKGEMEAELMTLGLAKLSIFRPSLLAGARSQFRFGERVGLLLAGLFGTLLPRQWRPIRDSSVANAMWRASREQREQVRIYQSGEMQLLHR
ncbi:NAD(P)H-binding protein [Permianibacter sp. IMCC34836]|uniref:NAD(P)H-binding protein n=1 Tax=Permianibacter fluminis TaxID=2738515 RepID=UPI0015567A63|nr:NAD(P)H-binding protein [Permianibacter fluminis]NQD36925.1 NAD(P)H-binding protein [Permianibacter fluminis]